MITEEDYGVPKSRNKPTPPNDFGFTPECKQALFNYFASYHNCVLMEDDFANIAHIVRELNNYEKT